ncbi:MAG: LLM class flavin-dependent oxidoreductase, partial [Pseudomonadota bacterium]
MSKPAYGPGYTRTFSEGNLSLGLIFPIEAHRSPVPDMHQQVELAQHAEKLGYAALWSRDVPLLDPTFGDAGQIYDPWVWLGYMAAHTRTIALATGSIILPLRPQVDLAKAAASVDQLSNGRLIMGVATGDRPVEYSVYNGNFES